MIEKRFDYKPQKDELITLYITTDGMTADERIDELMQGKGIREYFIYSISPSSRGGTTYKIAHPNHQDKSLMND